MSNMNFGSNFENIVLVYVNKNPHLYEKVDEDFFKNQTNRTLFKLAKEFYSRFKEQIFNPDSPNIGQIEVLVLEDKDRFQLDANATLDDNINNFLHNADYIIKTNLINYSEDWLDRTITAWIQWQNTQKGYRESISYMQTATVTPENVQEVIGKAKDIVLRRSAVSFDDEEVFDFFSPESHKQTNQDEYISSGYISLDKMLGGGFAPETLNIFLGSPNSGKSIVLGNIARNIAFSGKNVLLVSVEMSIRKIYKRIGSNTFNIPMSEYDRFSSDEELMSENLNLIQQNAASQGIPVGKLLGIKFTHATPTRIHETVRKLEEKHGIKFHAVVIDYLTELGNDFGISPEKMYIYHKTNADQLYQYAGDDKCAYITAHQIVGSAFNSGDMTMKDIGESRGLAHRADFLIGLICSEQMQIEKCMYFKNIKCRDSAYKNYYAKFDIDYSHMRLTENGDILAPEQFNVFTA